MGKEYRLFNLFNVWWICRCGEKAYLCTVFKRLKIFHKFVSIRLVVSNAERRRESPLAS